MVDHNSFKKFVFFSLEDLNKKFDKLVKFVKVNMVAPATENEKVFLF